MYQVEIYGRIRRAVLVEGRSQRSVAREFGLARVTVRKMLGYSIPPGYRRKEPARRPKLGPWMGVIDAILKVDKTQPVKQRHTAPRIFDRLRSEHGFTGGYTIVKDYVRSASLRQREVLIPLAHVAGTAQADFGEALVIVAGVEQKAHYLAIDLPLCATAESLALATKSEIEIESRLTSEETAPLETTVASNLQEVSALAQQAATLTNGMADTTSA